MVKNERDYKKMYELLLREHQELKEKYGALLKQRMSG